MNHWLQAAGFAPPSPFAANPSWLGAGLLGQGLGHRGDTEGTQRGHVGDAVPGHLQPPLSPPSHVHHVQELSPLTLPFPPVLRRATATFQSRGTPGASPQTPAPWLFAPRGLGTSAPCLLPAPSTEQPPWAPLALPAGNRWLCCKDLLQMLMLSLRWRALRMICQNGFHTLLLKLCPLLSRRWRRSAARRASGMRGARLAAAQAAEQG